MKNILSILLFLPLLMKGQQNPIALYTNDFKTVVENNQTLICDDLNSLGVRLIKNDQIMKYDQLVISVSFKYEGKKEDRWVGYKGYDLHKEYYTKKHGDKKVHNVYLIKSDPDQIGEEFSTYFTYHSNINTFRQAFCFDPERYNNFKIELTGHYITKEQYASDNDGGVSLQYTYDKGEVLGVTKFKIEPGEKTGQDILKRSQKRKVQELEVQFRDRFYKIEESYVSIIEIYGAQVKKIKKKNLYKAFLIVKESLLKEIESTEDVAEKCKKWQRLEQISLEMLPFLDKDTKNLEKSLKNVQNVDKILELMDI